MSNENREEFDEGAIESTEHDPDETRRLEERLEELRAEGILSGSPNHKEIADTKPLNLATQIDRLEAQGIVSSSRGTARARCCDFLTSRCGTTGRPTRNDQSSTVGGLCRYYSAAPH